MIEERRCSYEVCKLLHEKGFDVKCTDWYWENNINIWKPTHQMACDWLREVHHICITIYPDKEKGFEAVLYDTESDVEITIQSFGVFGYHIFESSYGEVVEAAIKYSLENLV